MKRLSIRMFLCGMAVAVLMGTAVTAVAQANEQFFPLLVYRTGPYAPNGVPFANGYADYLTLVNERDGGINGVKITSEECETGYATDRGVECYERLKGKGPTGATAFAPLSTGITFALTEKAPLDKIPLLTTGYGRSESVDGSVFKWNFPLLGTYWDAADILVQHIAKKEGGPAKLKGKKITLLYHDSPYGKEPIPVLQELSKQLGFEFNTIPVTHPGVEQKAAWLQIRQNKPDYVFLWGWGIMNSTAIKEAIAVGYPRLQMYGVWWAGAEPDVLPAEKAAKSYKPPAGARLSEQNIGLKSHIERSMPIFLTLRDREGKGLVTAMLPPKGMDPKQHRPILVGPSNADPYKDYQGAINMLAVHYDMPLDAERCYPYRRT